MRKLPLLNKGIIKNKVPLKDLLAAWEEEFPPRLAESWDHVGLEVGDTGASITGALVSLEVTPAAIAFAVKNNLNLIFVHHPLFFKPLARVDTSSEAGRILALLMKKEINLYAAHTNLDAAPRGLNHLLARRLHLDKVEPLAAAGEGALYKLVVFTPSGYETQVLKACFAAGGGKIGGYTDVAFAAPGEGIFTPPNGSHPFRGRPGQPERVKESRLEVLVPRERLSAVIAALKQAHPYEEVAYDVLPLFQGEAGAGLGRIGECPREFTLEEFGTSLRVEFNLPWLRMVGNPKRKVRRIALCTGHGGSLIRIAASRGADLLVTGDVSYHEARDAEALDLALLDPGHFVLEQFALKDFTPWLAKTAATRGIDIPLRFYNELKDPFQAVLPPVEPALPAAGAGNRIKKLSTRFSQLTYK